MSDKSKKSLFENGDPKVSIVIPVYNGSNFVANAIESALCQTYSNVEVVVVNDGSRDNGETAKICQRYNDSIIYIEQENQGVAGAMNTAFEHLTGDFFCWLSHDDEHLPNKTKKQIDFLRRFDRDDLMLFGNYFLMDDDGKTWHESQMNKDLLRKKPAIALLRGMINGCTLMIPTHIIKKHLPFRTDLRFTQDYDMWTRIREDGEFIFQPETLVRYRIHPGQDTHNPKANTEGDALWKWMMSKRSDVEKVMLNGSRKKYYSELATFLNNTPYVEATAYAEAKAKESEHDTLVSVIIPFYNEPDLTCRAIKSALSQTHPNIEVIVINDGSTENVDAVMLLAARHENVNLIEIENGGVGNARNTGLSHANGEYIAFLDSDDTFHPNKVSIQLAAMAEGGYVFSHTSYNVEYPGGRDGLGMVNSGVQNGELYPDLIRSCSISTPTVMIHSLLLPMGFNFPTESNLGEDIQAWLWVAARYPLLGLEEPLSTITWRDDSAALNIAKGIEGITSIIRAMNNHPMHRHYEEKIAGLNKHLSDLIKMQGFAKKDPMAKRADKIITLDSIRMAYGNAPPPKITDDTETVVLEVGWQNNPVYPNLFMSQASARS